METSKAVAKAMAAVELGHHRAAFLLANGLAKTMGITYNPTQEGTWPLKTSWRRLYVELLASGYGIRT